MNNNFYFRDNVRLFQWMGGHLTIQDDNNVNHIVDVCNTNQIFFNPQDNNRANVRRLHTQERCRAWGKTFCDLPKCGVYICNLTAMGLAIGQLFISDDYDLGVIALAVSQFACLLFGTIYQGCDIHNSKKDVFELRKPENGENASCSWAVNIFPGLVGLAIGAAGMITKITTNSPAGDVLNILAPIVSATGLSIIQSRYEEEKEIIAERYVRYIQAP